MDINYFEGYKDRKDKFNQFNTEVINMPRESFSDTGIEKLRVLSSYLLLIDETNDGLSYKEIMLKIKESLDDGNEPVLKDIDLENKYFSFHSQDIDEHYERKGREFRHLTGLCKLFKILINADTGRKSIINFDKCREFEIVEGNNLSLSVRNSILEINIRDNPLINNLKGIKDYIDGSSDYPIALNIIRYIQIMDRPVTKLEISFLLGRVDELNNQEDILERAIAFGNEMPRTFDEQKIYFFNYMGWINNDGSLFEYSVSEEPWFKFNTFLILMQQFGLIEFNTYDETIMLTDYSEAILGEEIPAYIADLEIFLENVDADNVADSEITDVIVEARQEGLREYLEENDDLIDLINQRSLRTARQAERENAIVERNKLVMLFSKIRKDYTCEVIYSLNSDGLPEFQYNKKLFVTRNNIGYCEGHHIIEFKRENGPDIVENILLTDPNTHMLLHHGHPSIQRDLYGILRREGILTLDRFIKMIEKYNCLTADHIEILSNKGIITFDEKAGLLNKINEQAV